MVWSGGNVLGFAHRFRFSAVQMSQSGPYNPGVEIHFSMSEKKIHYNFEITDR